MALCAQLRLMLSIATGIRHCMNAEREMEIERVQVSTWLESEPEGIYAFARICGKTYYRPGYFDCGSNEWVIP